MIGLYLHVPYCAVRCSYCDFYLVTGRGRDRDAYARALAAEIASGGGDPAHGEGDGAADPAVRADTLHLGGGTPSLLSPAALGGVLDAARARFAPGRFAEVALEANPEDVTRDSLAAWRDLGVTRLAVGVQSFDDGRLRTMRRPHDGARAAAALDLAVAAGFASVGADLILGTPGEGPHPTLEDVGRAVDLGVDHLSIYLLEIHPRTRMGRAVERGLESPLDPDAAAAVYEEVSDRLVAAGFEHYEISNFARPGRRSRHNEKYWTDQEYLGFGPSAHSYRGGLRWSNAADLDDYLRRGGRGVARVEDRQPAAVRGWEALCAGLRLSEGVDLDAFAARHPAATPPPGDPGLAALADAGLVTLAGRRLALTRRGRLVSNEIFERLAPVS